MSSYYQLDKETIKFINSCIEITDRQKLKPRTTKYGTDKFYNFKPRKKSRARIRKV